MLMQRMPRLYRNTAKNFLNHLTFPSIYGIISIGSGLPIPNTNYEELYYTVTLSLSFGERVWCFVKMARENYNHD